jgi:hypothetical protein
MGKRWLLKEVRGGRLSSLNFTDNSGVRYFAQEWPSKATDIVGVREGVYKVK